MHFGISLPQFGKFASADSLLRMATAAEDFGWDSVWGADHVVIPTKYAERFDGTFYDLFTTLGFIAAATKRVQIGTSVIVLPYRHPVVLAKQIATLDVLSGGRTIIGVAAGWMREEFDILGIPYERRGQRSDECLRALKAVWTSPVPDFAGEWYRFADFICAPQPLQRPHPPLWIGGTDQRTLQRVVEFGDGWQPISSARIGLSIEEFAERITSLRRLAEQMRRDPATITLSFNLPLAFDMHPGPLGQYLTCIGSSDEIVRRLEHCARLGVTHLIFSCFYSMPSKMASENVDEFLTTMERFTREVRPRL
jgi:probable F420-dependent oxidoreductase